MEEVNIFYKQDLGNLNLQQKYFDKYILKVFCQITQKN